jgi:hypothetical protein
MSGFDFDLLLGALEGIQRRLDDLEDFNPDSAELQRLADEVAALRVDLLYPQVPDGVEAVDDSDADAD